MHESLWKTHFPEFPASEDKVIKQLMTAAVIVHLPAGRQIFYPGKSCESYLLVISGSVKTQILSRAGREVLLYHVRAGESCVLTTSCLLGGNAYPAEAYAETDVSAFAIPGHVFHRCVETSPLFREFVFRNFSNRLADVIRRMETITFGRMERKLAAQLLAERTGTVCKTHGELAQELGSVREVVSRHLKRFESEGWLSLGRGSIHLLDERALQKIVDIGQAD